MKLQVHTFTEDRFARPEFTLPLLDQEEADQGQRTALEAVTVDISQAASAEEASISIVKEAFIVAFEVVNITFEAIKPDCKPRRSSVFLAPKQNRSVAHGSTPRPSPNVTCIH